MSIFPIIPLGNTFVGATYHAAKVFNDDFCDRVVKLIKEDAWVQAGTEDLKAKSKQQIKKEKRINTKEQMNKQKLIKQKLKLKRLVF